MVAGLHFIFRSQLRSEMIRYQMRLRWLQVLYHTWDRHQWVVVIEQQVQIFFFLDIICEKLDQVMCVILTINSNLWVTWISNEIYRAVKWKIGSYVCGLSQVNNVPTRTWQKSDGTEISSCINWHILINYNAAVSWTKEISILLGCSANNLT